MHCYSFMFSKEVPLKSRYFLSPYCINICAAPDMPYSYPRICCCVWKGSSRLVLFSSCLQLFNPNYFHISYRRGDHWCGRHGSRGSQENQFCEKITKYFVNTVLFNLRKPAFARKCALQYILSRFFFFNF